MSFWTWENFGIHVSNIVFGVGEELGIVILKSPTNAESQYTEALRNT